MRSLAILLFLVLFLSIFPVPAQGDEIVNYYVISEGITKGTSDGFDNEMEGDSVRNVKTEANNGTTTLTVEAQLDTDVGWANVGGTGLSAHYEALTQTGEPDENTSYINHNVQTYPWDTFDVSATLAATTVITQVVLFANSRKNSTGTASAIYMNLTSSGTPCATSAAKMLTVEWVEYTETYAQNCAGATWTAANIASINMAFQASPGASNAVSITYAGITITYQTNYWLDITQTINLPSEQIEEVKIVTEGDLSGDSQGFTLQIAGSTVATNMYVSPNQRGEFIISERGDIQIRIYQNPDPTQSVLNLDLLVAEVRKSGGSSGLKAPDPQCTYDSFFMNFNCVDTQEYGNMKVLWVRWSIDDKSSTRSDPNGKVSLPSGEGFWEMSSRPHIVYATAVYESGAEMPTSIEVHSNNGIRLLFPFLIILIIILVIVALVRIRRGKKPDEDLGL